MIKIGSSTLGVIHSLCYAFRREGGRSFCNSLNQYFPNIVTLECCGESFSVPRKFFLEFTKSWFFQENSSDFSRKNCQKCALKNYF